MATRDKFFQPLAAGANNQAAWALGVLANLTYAHRDDLIAAWAAAFGFQTGKRLLTPGTLIPNVFFAASDEQIVVGVPGTENAMQMLQNILYSGQRTNPAFGGGRMHSFFLWCAEGIVQAVQTELAKYPKLKEICITGHSLGGAVAQLLADAADTAFPGKVKLCVTFNSPRVGDLDWATRVRGYPTHLYYHTHDMICELPPPFLPTSTAYQTQLGIVDNYTHRDTLVPVQSRGGIDESWAAVTVTKVSESPRLLNAILPTRIGLALEHSSWWSRFSRFGMRCGLASWILPLPQWWRDHRMIGILNSMRRLAAFQLPDEVGPLEGILLTLPPEPIPDLVLNMLGVSPLVPTAQFVPGQVTGDGTIAGLPVITFPQYTECIESSFVWDEQEGAPPAPLTNFVDEMFFGLMDEAIATGQTPYATSTPAVIAGIPARPDWEFRVTDRNILNKTLECMEGIERRDGIALDSDPTEAISTRELIADMHDAELSAAWLLVKEAIRDRLSLVRE